MVEVGFPYAPMGTSIRVCGTSVIEVKGGEVEVDGVEVDGVEVGAVEVGEVGADLDFDPTHTGRLLSRAGRLSATPTRPQHTDVQGHIRSIIRTIIRTGEKDEEPSLLHATSSGLVAGRRVGGWGLDRIRPVRKTFRTRVLCAR